MIQNLLLRSRNPPIPNIQTPPNPDCSLKKQAPLAESSFRNLKIKGKVLDKYNSNSFPSKPQKYNEFYQTDSMSKFPDTKAKLNITLINKVYEKLSKIKQPT